MIFSEEFQVFNSCGNAIFNKKNLSFLAHHDPKAKKKGLLALSKINTFVIAYIFVALNLFHQMHEMLSQVGKYVYTKAERERDISSRIKGKCNVINTDSDDYLKA